jgi:NADP-dependent 3-hydroxy acid dehydrogenase YdfG
MANKPYSDSYFCYNLQSISPGLVKSNIFKSCLGPDVHDAVYKKPSLDPNDVASAIEYALSSPTHVQVSLAECYNMFRM